MKSPLEHEHDRQKSGQSWKLREDLANQGSRDKIWPIKGAEIKSSQSRDPRENRAQRKSGQSREPREICQIKGAEKKNLAPIWPIKRAHKNNQGSREKIWPIKGAERKSGHSREPRENLVNQGNREKIWPIKRDEREKNLQGGVCGGAKLVLTILF